MVILERPFASDLMVETIEKNGIPVLKNEMSELRDKKFRIEIPCDKVKAARIRCIFPGGEVCSACIDFFVVTLMSSADALVTVTV